MYHIVMPTVAKRLLRRLPYAATCLVVALAAGPAMGLAQSPAIPSYAVKSGETIRGTIANFNGAYTMYVRDVKGYVDNVTLHQGTVINPTGIRLQTGFPVSIIGHAAGTTFVADEIDTPVRYTTYRYYPYYGLGYGAYPYPYPYAYTPYFGIGFSYGWGWGWGGGWRRWH